MSEPPLAESWIEPRPIVDAHIHLWDLDTHYYPWLSDGNRPSAIKDYAALRRNYVISNFRRDSARWNIVGCVHVQAQHDPADLVEETRWLQDVADTDPAGMPQAIVADADLASPDLPSILERHCAFRNIRGIRQSLNRRLGEVPPYDPLLDPAWIANFPRLAAFGLSFDMELAPRQADRAIALIKANPAISVIFTHAGIPFTRDAESVALWRSAIRRYANLPNTAIKLSGFGVFEPDWDWRSLDAVFGPVIEAFTPARCMLASNFPVEGLWSTYDEVWQAYSRFFSGSSEEEKDDLFWRNARRYYRF
jgi:predicted TIM-barrel fold metal-dependent hydrolase